MSALGTLEIHIHHLRKEYLGTWHPDYVETEGESYVDHLRSEVREAGFCDLTGAHELDALTLPHGTPNPMTWSEVICHLTPTDGSTVTSLPCGTQIYVFKAIAKGV